MAAFREEWPCLLVVPSSLREVWADALVEWLGVTERDMLLVGACAAAGRARRSASASSSSRTRSWASWRPRWRARRRPSPP